MSMPEFPDVDIDVSLTKDQSVNLLLASIAFEELGLAHLINSEAEKIQYVLGTLENQTQQPVPSIADLISINSSVQQTLKNIIKTEMLLQFKLEEAIAVIQTDNICYPCFAAASGCGI